MYSTVVLIVMAHCRLSSCVLCKACQMFISVKSLECYDYRTVVLTSARRYSLQGVIAIMHVYWFVCSLVILDVSQKVQVRFS